VDQHLFVDIAHGVLKGPAAGESERWERRRHSVSFTVPIILAILCVAISVLIFWGGFSEESRGSKTP
jgi:hypothetical protein